MPDNRVTLRKRSSFRTRSNRVKKVKTPGGKLTVHYLKKKGSKPKCGDTGHDLHGISVVRPKKLMKLSKPKKTVTRVYGGCLSAKAVRSRIIRAFLIEERLIVKNVMKNQKASK
eukprot:Plantae.Rhodophyta-Purpureofilum_apyrenoidigerum.ctg36679.p1 GENE.Plantae.Rhodophyta-Purpureofilum_apyrenoidigerum.ctg36679~~Plantae.Rhodophyta-Purpureofilum_apyrenoidigerum.ctg36679.p1  ORF type:complete len:114 (+),score=29.66 Plantae.Rhodophyta-Purpureofilum_apyrenoidigerum.ctg36679:137-478(+)